MKAFSLRRDYEPLDRWMRDLVRVLRLSKSIPAYERERRLMRLIACDEICKLSKQK